MKKILRLLVLLLGVLVLPATAYAQTNYGDVNNDGEVNVADVNVVIDVAADFVLNENDLLGAFAEEQCLGVAQLQEGYFFIYINSPAESSSQVTLRYYSAFYKNLFEAKDAFPFKNDDILGTVAEPLIPAFVVVK